MISDAKTAPRVVPVVKRLLAKGVAGEHEPPLSSVPQREGEHAVEGAEDGVAVLLVSVHDRLGVALGAEGVSAFEPGPELAEVVDLAVQQRLDLAVLARDGMVGLVREIDDGETAVREADARHPGLGEKTLGVGAAVLQRVGDALQVRARGLAAVEVDDPADAAHPPGIVVAQRRTSPGARELVKPDAA